MEIFWAIFASAVLVLIIIGMFNSRRDRQRPVSIGNIELKKLNEVFDLEKRYDVVINSGARFEGVKILGFAEAVGGPDYDIVWSARRWLILEDSSGGRVFIGPQRIMWMKEA